jgi:hypothetical protein
LIAKVDGNQAKRGPYTPESFYSDDSKPRQTSIDGGPFQGLGFSISKPQSRESHIVSERQPAQELNPSRFDDGSVPEQFFGRGLLTVEKACSFLATFREMSSYFPFVILPAEATVQSMFLEQPFLLLAVLAASSSAEKKLQHVLEEELRSTLSSRVVLEGEKSLDLLQGLLVYLAWSAICAGNSEYA